MPSTEPSDAVIADLIHVPMIEALTGYGQGALTARQALVAIIKAIPAQRYVGIAQTYGLIPQDPTMFVANVLGRLGEVEVRIRELDERADAHTLALTDQGRRTAEKIDALGRDIYKAVNGNPDRS